MGVFLGADTTAMQRSEGGDKAGTDEWSWEDKRAPPLYEPVISAAGSETPQFTGACDFFPHSKYDQSNHNIDDRGGEGQWLHFLEHVK